MCAAVSNVKNLISKNLHVHLSMSEAKTNKSIQHFLEIRPKLSLEKKIYEMVISAAVAAEKHAPGSAILLLQQFVAENTKEAATTNVLHTKHSILKQLNHLSKKNIAIAETIIELASGSSSIILKKSTNGNFFIEMYEGYVFSANCLIDIRPCTIKNVAVSLIDGYVENVSEIHHLLTSLAESQQKCLIFCRGMSSDVSHTIKVNNDRGIMSVYPYQIPFDIDGINTLVDIATVVGCDVTSSLKGDLISSIKAEQLLKVSGCSLQKDKVTFSNASTKKSVNSHIKNIREKMENNPDLSETLQKRVRSLSASCLEIGIPNDINYASNSMELDEAIRHIMAAASRGMQKEEVVKKYLESLNETISNLGCMV